MTMPRRSQRPSYGLCVERDGIVLGLPKFDKLESEESALTQLTRVRSEPATMNAEFGTRASYIHLLRHDATNAECLGKEHPWDDRTIVKAFAPEPEATVAQDHEAAAAWLADRADAAGIGQMDLYGLVHDAAAAEASDVNNQTSFLLRQFGREGAMKLIAGEADGMVIDD